MDLPAYFVAATTCYWNSQTWFFYFHPFGSLSLSLHNNHHNVMFISYTSKGVAGDA